MQPSYVRRSTDGWENVEHEGYVPGEAGRIVRHTLIGHRKASTGEAGPQLEVRYFEVPPGTATRLEKHEHEHFVIVGEGLGHAIVGSEVREVGPRDVVYVAALEPHQFVNRGSSTFGFFCVVTAHRDPAQAIDDAELAAIRQSEAGAVVRPEFAPRPTN